MKTLQGALDRLTRNCPYGKPLFASHRDINSYMWIRDYSYGHGRFISYFMPSDELVDELMYGDKYVDFDGELYMALFEAGLDIEAVFMMSLLYD